MKRYVIWCRWTPLVGQVPQERDKQWNMQGVHGNPWGYKTYEKALQRADVFKLHWQPGFMETHIVEVELPE